MGWAKAIQTLSRGFGISQKKFKDLTQKPCKFPFFYIYFKTQGFAIFCVLIHKIRDRMFSLQNTYPHNAGMIQYPPDNNH
jgi:hypothetical protein